MTDTTSPIVERLNRLGLHCNAAPTDELPSAVTALACFPMYCVANVHAWSKDTEWEIPLVDLPGFESIREAFAIGREEKHMQMSDEHRRLLGTLLGHAKPSDRVMYDFAIETLAIYLAAAKPEIAEQIRHGIAKTIVAVASASGEGLLGTGEKINRHERRTIEEITAALDLEQSPAAKEILAEID